MTDRINAGADDASIIVASSATPLPHIYIWGAADNVNYTVDLWEGVKVLSHLTIIGGGANNDILFGDAGNNRGHGDGGTEALNGNGGDDFILDRDGTDLICGICGSNLLDCEMGADFNLIGNVDDTVDGGLGVDTRSGGPGANIIHIYIGDGDFTCNFNCGDEVHLAADTISDFSGRRVGTAQTHACSTPKSLGHTTLVTVAWLGERKPIR